MPDSLQIRIHGRGGQGNVVAAYLLAAAAIRAGFEAQAFPAFGAERRGAPVTAFVRIRQTPIRRRAEIEHPDFLVVQDAKLLRLDATLAGLAEGGGIVVNAEDAQAVPVLLGRRFRVAAVPASRIAGQTVGANVPNVPLIAALIGLTGVFPVEALIAALGDRFNPATAARNAQAAEAALAAVPAGSWHGTSNSEEVSHAPGH